MDKKHMDSLKELLQRSVSAYQSVENIRRQSDGIGLAVEGIERLFSSQEEVPVELDWMSTRLVSLMGSVEDLSDFVDALLRGTLETLRENSDPKEPPCG